MICAGLLAAGLYFTELTLFVYIALLFLVGILWLLPCQRQILIEKLRGLGVQSIAISLLVFVMIGLPFVSNWLASDALPPDSQEAFRYSSNLAGFFIPSQKTTPLYGSLFTWLSDRITVGHPEPQIFLGFPSLIFGLVALIWLGRFRNDNQRLIIIISLVLTLIFFILSLGPTLKIFSLDTGFPLPYYLLVSIPPFNVGRTPIRFVSIGLFFWMIVAAFGLQLFQQFLTDKSSRLTSTMVVLLIFIWITAEVYTSVKPQPPYVWPAQLKNMVDGPTISLPLRYHDGWSLLLQMFHRQPLATGYVSRNSKKQQEHFETMRVLYAEALQSGSCERFIKMGFRNVIIGDRVPDDVVIGLKKLSNCRINVVDIKQ